MKNIFSNWKTSVAGLVLSFGQYLMLQGEHGFTWDSFLIAFPTLLLGLFSSDPSKQ